MSFMSDVYLCGGQMNAEFDLNPTFVDLSKEPVDYKKYSYAVCECTICGEAIRINRPFDDGYFSFQCPKCGKFLGLNVYNRPPLDPDYKRCGQCKNKDSCVVSNRYWEPECATYYELKIEEREV